MTATEQRPTNDYTPGHGLINWSDRLNINVYPSSQMNLLELGQSIVSHGYGLVYGGGTKGLMGCVAQSVSKSGGHVIGITPKALAPVEVSGEAIGSNIEVPDMHTRKSMMNEKAGHSPAGAFIVLPGGYGTMEELLEITTWSQLNIHSKPIILLNIRGYFDPLLLWIDRAVEEGFLAAGNRNILVACGTVDEAMAQLATYEAPTSRYMGLKWTHPTSTDII
ncbi:hypothetical protein BJ085DRAFT_37837 [Dimargaris cristalligena]|uniref:Cytokinin riboside 5'-monophosphate phosphoribohydrolase n=1 Tax=Dimargaris cristalligena TaxID=215637 RepID=A0A4V1J5S3_9FUNG|nr:hypothetical protein BJ085DRAFT_37837 [Dimargaris cristalligena]|eukprot:RKP40059.1 hypothetical protein BJ085DRAFT_37837 [Dimargaris cristalligena]